MPPKPIVEWEKYEPMLGTMPDVMLAKLAGCSPNAISVRRRDKGIRAFCEKPPQKEAAKPKASQPSLDFAQGARYRLSRKGYRQMEKHTSPMDYIFGHVTKNGLFVFTRADIGVTETFTRQQLSLDYQIEHQKEARKQ